MPPTATKLNQIIAVRQGVQSQTERTVTALHHRLQKGEPLSGIERVYTKRFDQDADLPPERKHVQVLADEALAEAAGAWTRMWDVTAAVDFTNASGAARADVVVDGQVLVADAPVSYLIFLEKQLNDVRTFIDKLPVLDPAYEWSREHDSAPWRTRPAETTSTRKVPKNHVRAEATERHPAQVDVYQEDVVVGFWSTVKLSGAVPARRVAELRQRITVLIDAVKVARETANMADVVDPKPASGVFDYLLAPSR